MLDLNQRKAAWVTSAFGWAIMPNGTIMDEMSVAMLASRKRTKSLWKGGGCCFTINVRGRDVVVLNKARCVKLVLDEADETNGILKWFVDELYSDLKKHGVSVGDADGDDNGAGDEHGQ